MSEFSRFFLCYWRDLNHVDILEAMPSFSSMLAIVWEWQCQSFIYISFCVCGYGLKTSQLASMPVGSLQENSIGDDCLLMSHMCDLGHLRPLFLQWSQSGCIRFLRGHRSAHYSVLGMKGPLPSVNMTLFMGKDQTSFSSLEANACTSESPHSMGIEFQ